MTNDKTKQIKLNKIANFITDGDTVGEACKKVNVTTSQYYAWRKTYKTATRSTRSNKTNNNAMEFFIITNNADSARNLLQGLV